MTNLIVAACLILEAGGEGRDGMNAVREVISNRAAHRRLTEERVVLQPWQFSAFNGTTPAQAVLKASKHPRWPLALELSARPPATSLTHGAQFYCTLNTFPAWATGKQPVVTIRNHKFYRN